VSVLEVRWQLTTWRSVVPGAETESEGGSDAEPSERFRLDMMLEKAKTGEIAKWKGSGRKAKKAYISV
jgi:hypothetical protein